MTHILPPSRLPPDVEPVDVVYRQPAWIWALALAGILAPVAIGYAVARVTTTCEAVE